MKKMTLIVLHLFIFSMAQANSTLALLEREKNNIMKSAKNLDNMNIQLQIIEDLQVLYTGCHKQLQDKKIPYDCYEYNHATVQNSELGLIHTQIKNLTERCEHWATKSTEVELRTSQHLDPRCLSSIQNRMKILSYKRNALD